MTRRVNKGFTLIELMLSMAFVGALLVAIAMTTIHIMGTYTKGLTVREVNQAGRTISEDIQQTIAASAPFRVDLAENENEGPGLVERTGSGGRFCTGTFTYAWNYGGSNPLDLESTTPAYNIFTEGSDTIRLVKVSDPGGVLCLDPERQIERSQTKELLSESDRNLAIQAFTIKEGARDDVSGQAIYAISFVLGTNNREGFTLLNASNSACLPPSASSDGDQQASDNQSFCAINKFNIIARAGNRAGSL